MKPANGEESPHPVPRTLGTRGYCVLPQVLETREIVAVRAAINETIDRVAMALRTPFRASCPGVPVEQRLQEIAARNRPYAHALFHAVLADAHRDPRIDGLATQRLIREATDILLAPQTRGSHVVRLHVAVPAFAGVRSAWRQDALRAGERGQTTRLACWIPLHDVDETTGALEIAPGAWRERLRHVRDESGLLHIPDLAAGERRVMAMRRGDVLVLDRFLPYRALPVAEDAGRWAVMVWIAASSAALFASGDRAGRPSTTDRH